jgi:4-hydroxybenzoate polyprenyltransferase
VFVPLAAAHGPFDLQRLSYCLAAFIAFCLCASSVYVLNDLLDMAEDRSRPQTALRPLASGQLKPRVAVGFLASLLLAAMTIGAFLPRTFLAALAAYYLLMAAYSLALKQVLLLDVLVLAAGYSLRLAAGAWVADVRVSPWLIVLCGSLFMSLALLKRYAELMALRPASASPPPGASAAAVADSAGPLPVNHVRSYLATDAPIVAAQGIASSHVSVLVLALYNSSANAQRLYAHPGFLWLLCVLLLYWINYLWLMARRGRVPHDPISFALRDRTSQMLIGAMVVTALLAV